MRLTLSSKWLRRSEAGQTSKSSWYCGCSGPSRLSLMPETTSQTGGSGVSLLQVPCATNTLRLACDAGQLSHAL